MGRAASGAPKRALTPKCSTPRSRSLKAGNVGCMASEKFADENIWRADGCNEVWRSPIQQPRGAAMRPTGSSSAASPKTRSSLVRFRVESKWPLISEVCSSMPTWRRADDREEEYDVLWTDAPISMQRFGKLRPYQKLNHFLGMSTITWKHSLCQNMSRMKLVFPEEYSFFPDTWELPEDLSSFKQASAKRNTTFICKPTSSACGRGIFLTRGLSKITSELPSKFIAQQYIEHPSLLGKHKFDLRLYVLVVDCSPLRVFLHREGLVRLATEEYQQPTSANLKNKKMHLTNYSVNADTPGFVENSNPEDGLDGHKRSLRAVLPELQKLGCDTDRLVANIEEMVVKTFLAVQPRLAYLRDKFHPKPDTEPMSFEILGFDVMIDQDEKPWLLEVNHAPSFSDHTELDRLVKYQVVREALTLLDLSAAARNKFKRRAKQDLAERALGAKRSHSLRPSLQAQDSSVVDWEKRERQSSTGYKRLYPSSCPGRAVEHARYLHAATHLWASCAVGCSPSEPHRSQGLSASRRKVAASTLEQVANEMRTFHKQCS